MFKKIVSIAIAAMMLGSTAAIAATAAEDGSAVAAADDSSAVAAADDSAVGADDGSESTSAGSKIYFDAASSGWKTYKKIYLYLYPKGSETDHQQWADVEVNTAEAGRNNWHYTGYTNTEHTGILKIDGKKIPFSGPDAVRWNEDFTLDLQDGADDEDHVPAGTGWTDIKVSGSASLKETLSSTSPGMSPSPSCSPNS